MFVRHAALAAIVVLAGPAHAAEEHGDKTAVQKEIWAKEQQIYAARGRGDMGPYIANVAKDYLAWPPGDRPVGNQNLADLQTSMATDNKEVMTMEFADFSLNGDAAVIYYRTHRTRLPNGQAVDQRYHVIHSWVWQDGVWKLLGGMARPTP